ncbi:hypothetical protein DRP53_02070 [candidate division WOR-3 bacterium]|uniref:Peptidase M14 domain-containing protein n=1 Tax=candidate division WOR-3 bacterium TaxID=2052148 RepID=A0A660SMW5_UNCW3|nr:MAG: hypothetical protein DRP53_02070 [candidate division WOR-3 bacterium]
MLLLFLVWSTKLIEIPISGRGDVDRLSHYAIVDVEPERITLLARDEELEGIRRLGYHLRILIEDYEAYLEQVKILGKYHSYHELDSILNEYARKYPRIARLETIGYSVQGRCIFAMKISDNVAQDEAEPVMRLIGNMHGDEFIGCEIPLYFLTYLLDNYQSSSQVRGLVDSIEFYIIPMLNPDGHELNQRYNANGVDLNRDCGYFWEGWGNSPSPFSQPETRIYLAHNYEHNNISIEYNYHSVARYVNYVWDYHPHDPPDSEYIVQLSHLYASQAGLQVTNGYEWYQVCGSLQDATFGDLGGLAWTIETPQPSDPGQIDQICYENRNALLTVGERVKWGIWGYVTDSLTGDPLWARVRIDSPYRWNCYTDSIQGDYHKMLPEGSYRLTFWAPGYKARSLSVVVPASGAVRLDTRLLPDSTQHFGFQVVATRYARHAEDRNNTQPHDALFSPDHRFFSLGQSGFIIIDMGRPIRNGPGDDLTIYEGDGTAEGYSVSASNSPFGPWHDLGGGSGTSGFDLTTGGLDQARYIKITDDGSPASGPYAGFDLDAIEAIHSVPGVVEKEIGHPLVRILSTPAPILRLELSRPARLLIYDPAGRMIRRLAERPGLITIRGLRPGIYFVRVEGGGAHRVIKLVIIS